LIQVKGKVEIDLVYELLGRAREVERAFARREKKFPGAGGGCGVGKLIGVAVIG
jgi:hypothetical protein